MTDNTWLGWPPPRRLLTGHEYLVRTRAGTQKLAREHRMSYLGTSAQGDGSLLFNARPFAGTQVIHPDHIVATCDIGLSGGREHNARYMNKIVRD